jgi:1,4-alpha-glucan branching enzyme
MLLTKKQEAVTFSFSPSAPMKNVCLVGDFNQWKVGKDPMKKNSNGSFRLTKKLPSGRYEYKFYADGLFWEDPKAQEHAVNSFGTRNSVVTVG